MKKLSLLILLFSTVAFAAVVGYSGSTNIGTFSTIKCDTGLTCTAVGSTFNMVSSPTLTGSTLALTSTFSAVGNFSINTNKFTIAGSSGNTAILGDVAVNTNKFTVAASTGNTAVAGTLAVTGNSTLTGSTGVVGNFAVNTNKFTVAAASGNSTVAGTLGVTGATTLTGGLAVAVPKTNFQGWAPPTLTSGTSSQGSTTVLYICQIFIPMNTTITGIKINNAGTVGTDKYLAAMFNSSGGAVANSSLSGILAAGADAYQALPFTGTYAAVGPAMYWIGVYINGGTLRYRSVPASGEGSGLCGSVTGQTYATIVTITPPTTFTADKGPVAFTY